MTRFALLLFLTLAAYSNSAQQTSALDRISRKVGIVISRDCGKHKGVYIDCTPKWHEGMPKEYKKTSEEIRIGCIKYINKMAKYTNLVDFSCSQMSGGPLVIQRII